MALNQGSINEQPMSEWNFFSFLQSEEAQVKSRFQRHTKILIWKCYLQRQRRWLVLLVQCMFGLFLFVLSVIIAKPVFLAPIEATPEQPITSTELIASLNNTILGYAPNTPPFDSIMQKAEAKFNLQFMSAITEDDLNNQLYLSAQGQTVNKTIIWIIFKPEIDNFWRFSIKSTERVVLTSTSDDAVSKENFHSMVFLGVQMVVSEAILEEAVPTAPLDFEITLTAMPVSPLMQSHNVKLALSIILMCFTLALLPPVIEAQALVIHETQSKFKHALLMRNVSYSSIYIGWLVYAYLTVFPICVMGAIVLILIFRWIHLMYALITLMSYVSVMLMLALIMSMFHNTALISCLWSTVFTVLQTFLAELLVHHGFDEWNTTVSFVLNIIIPPLGLIHAFNQFALLQTGDFGHYDERWSILYTILMWTVMNALYFAILMLLQRTIGQERAIGGQVSWKSIIFKEVEDKNQLRPIQQLTGRERENLQEVDELVAKAISFRNVSKSIMNVKVLENVTLDIYRGEYTNIFGERIQAKMVNTCEDLITGLSLADEGSIHILGKEVTAESNLMSSINMMGYCHHSMFLVHDLSVQEHLELFAKICLWNEPNHFVTEYSHIRFKRLLAECCLDTVRHVHVENLSMFFKAQLCWAIAMILEPRIVIVPDYADPHAYISVLRDKIMKYKKFITILKFSYTTFNMIYADRIFVFDNKNLVFGGTPAYMFFKYGREYRIRITFRGGGSFDNSRVDELLDTARKHGALTRANLGSLIILRMPTNPTASVAALIKEIQEKSVYYGVSSYAISLPDSEEICKRAINIMRDIQPTLVRSNEALKQFTAQTQWTKRESFFLTMDDMRSIGWKYFSFCVYYRLYFILTVIMAITAGILIGLSLSSMLSDMGKDHATISILHGEILTVEQLKQQTTLILSADSSVVSRSIVAAYALSETNVTKSQTEGITYTCLKSNESLVEYLITRAIDSPQQYVYMYAYGINVTENANKLSIHALFSPMHKDKSAAARSLARCYMALIRHYTGQKNATIQVTDDPLSLDFTPFLKYAGKPPLVIMFLLIVTMSHVTFIPSKEHGLMKHLQSNAYNFSPLQYWTSLYFCDLILYWLLVGFIAITIVCVMYLTVPVHHFQYSDLLVVPFILIIYAVSCIPQSYLFCRGPRAALNAMSFIITNLVFGEATVVAKMFFDLENVLLFFMRMWPQFNTGFAIVKIKQIFLYNSECIIFKTENLCSSKTLHKCCEKCGLLQQCYTKRHYLTSHGILGETKSMLIMTVIFISSLLLWEYKIIQLSWSYLMTLIKGVEVDQDDRLSPGAMREKGEVLDKLRELKSGHSKKVNTFGESLLCANLTKKDLGEYVLRNVYLGLGRGEALAISGLKKHGRVALIETLAGLRIPSSGQLWTMSKYRLNLTPHQYCRQVSIGCERDPLPLWMTVYDALQMIAILRGIPTKHVAHEIWKFIYALELFHVVDTLICLIPATVRSRINFAAAVIGSPPVIIIDECTNFQEYSVCRAMYFILYQMKRKGHAIFISSHSIESHMPMTNRLGILLDGRIVDVDLVDNLIARYTLKGYTVVVHLKDEVNVERMFGVHFKDFVINDTTDVLVNVQVLDSDLNWKTIFEKMEELQASNSQVYSYIVTSIPIDYIYNSIIVNEIGNKQTSGDLFTCQWLSKLCRPNAKMYPTKAMVDSLISFESKYEITRLKELPWSVIFQR